MLQEITSILCPYLDYITILVLSKTSKSIKRRISSRYLVFNKRKFERMIEDEMTQSRYPAELFDIIKTNEVAIGGDFLYSKNEDRIAGYNQLVFVISFNPYYNIHNQDWLIEIKHMIQSSYDNVNCQRYIDSFRVLSYDEENNEVSNDTYVTMIDSIDGISNTSYYDKCNQKRMKVTRKLNTFDVVSMFEYPILYDWKKLYI